MPVRVAVSSADQVEPTSESPSEALAHTQNTNQMHCPLYTLAAAAAGQQSSRLLAHSTDALVTGAESEPCCNCTEGSSLP